MIVESVMELVLLLSRAHCGAVFHAADREPILVVSQAIHQESFAAGMRIWAIRRRELLSTRGPIHLPTGLVIPVPLKAGGCGYLYADEPQPGFRLAEDRCATFQEILEGALASLTAEPSKPAPAPGLNRSSDQDRDLLKSLLDEEEWNISRVARILGVKRATIYNRLARFKIARQRVPKKT